MSSMNGKSSFEALYIGDNSINSLPCPYCQSEMLCEYVEQRHGSSYYFNVHDRNELLLTTSSLCTGCGATVKVTDANAAMLDVTYRYPAENNLEIGEYWKMGISTVKYGRVRNLGNYETERTEVEVQLEDGQTPEQGLVEAKRFVNKQLGLGATDKEIDAARNLLVQEGVLDSSYLSPMPLPTPTTETKEPTKKKSRYGRSYT